MKHKYIVNLVKIRQRNHCRRRYNIKRPLLYPVMIYHNVREIDEHVFVESYAVSLKW